MTIRHLGQRRFELLVLLVTLLASVYMVTYSAHIESTDTLFMFDAVSSLYRFGDLLIDEAAGEWRYWNYTPPLPEYPLNTVEAEPLQIWLALPLYALADRLPGIGLVHAVWLFNVMVTAAAGGLFFLYALALGYSETTSTLGTLAFGLLTVVWPYSKSFFQEPLTLFTLLLTAYCLEKTRQQRSVRWVLTALFAFGFAVLARSASLIALPALVLILSPWADLRPLWQRRAFLGLFLLVTIVLGVLAFGLTLDRLLAWFPDLNYYQRRDFPSMVAGVQGLLFSVGGSVWGTSPILLLAVPGAAHLYRNEKMRYIVVAATMLLAYAIVYPVLSPTHWFGGLSWPPRFLVPVVPFLLLCALPIVDSRRWRWPAAALALYSLWIQWAGVSLWWGTYPQVLPPEANGLIEWAGGLNDLRYLRWVRLPMLWRTLPHDFIWVRSGLWFWPVAFGALIALALWGMRAQRRVIAVVLPLLWSICVVLGLRAAYYDDEHLAFNENLFEALAIIDAETSPEDIVLVSTLGYERFFLNYAKHDGARIIGLPDHPGEQYSPEQPAERESAYPEGLLRRPMAQFIHHIAGQRDTIWLLSDRSEFVPYARRPVERTLAESYYLLDSYPLSQDGAIVRLMSFDTTRAPSGDLFVGPVAPTEFRFGEEIALAGFTLPRGANYRPGGTIPLSLQWLPLQNVDTDYVVAYWLRDESNAAVAQGVDSRPNGGFALTQTWEAGVSTWDHRALRIPADTPSGDYQLWVGLYSFGTDGAPTLASVVGGETVEDGTIAVLPIRVEVTE